ncbi:carboxypeptidase-like regulatory domain-containing protein [Seonamhaeicola aphaedonensis]|nr:carboxypeptidase-like regulatory domain-containing protein [Seonamhaeicola aphaedonensis]
MRRIFLFIGFLCFIFIAEAQIVKRVEVEGIIHADANDVEGITVYNSSSNVGTITNEKGEFSIAVAVNDIIQISALQFKALSITVQEDAVRSGKLGIHLVEQIHKLDAVLLSSGLTGNITTDIENVSYLKPVILKMGSMNVDYEYYDDKAFDAETVQKDLKSRISKGELYNGFDVKKISKLIFGKKNKEYIKPEYVVVEKPIELFDVYSPEYISEMFQIPLEDVNDFIAYVDTKDLDKELLKKDHEIECLQFLYEISKEYLKDKNAKD